MNRLRSLLGLEPGEEAPAFLLFGYLTLIMASYIITQAVRDGLFLYKFSAYELPYVYLAIATLISFVVWIYLKVAARIGQAAVIGASLLFFILNILLQWWAVKKQWAPVTKIFYVWTSIFGIIIVTQVWTVANYVLDLRQARRLFPFISSGAILGSTVGGFTAARLVKVKFIGTDNLMVLLIPLLVVAGVLAQILLSSHSHSHSLAPRGTRSRPIGFLKSLQTIKASPYLKLIVLLLACSNIVTLVVGIQFADIVKHTFPVKDQITAFMGTFKASFSLLSFFLQVAAGSWLLGKFGVRGMILVLPLALTGGTLVLLAFPLALWAGMALKGGDHTLRYSVDRATTELLYLPLPQATMSRVKAVIDMVMQRVADGVGALLVLFVTRTLKGGQVSLCVLDLVLLALWLGIALRTRKEYVRTLIDAVLDGRAPGKEVIRPFVDPDSLPGIKTLLASKDAEVVLTGIEMALQARHPELIPRELLRHPSEAVRAKALEVLTLTDQELLDRVHNDSSSVIRASAILTVTRRAPKVQPSAAGVSEFLRSPDLQVRLAALIAMVQHNGGLPPGAIKRELEQTVRDLEPAGKQWRAVAATLGEIPHPEAVELHLRLLQHPDPAVKKEAISSAGRAGHRELVPFLTPLLRDAKWAPDVRATLREYGSRILGVLADTLKDPSEDIEVRRSIPLVLANVPDQASVGILINALSDYDGLVRYRSIRALGRLRLVDPDLRFESEKIVRRIREDGDRARWFQQARVALYPQDESKDLLLQLFKDKFERGKDRVFRMLALLLSPRAALGSIWVIREGDPLARAKAIELLDNLLPGNLKHVVLPLIEPKTRWPASKPSSTQILRACLQDPDPILRECTADAVRKGRWPEVTGLEPLLARI